MICQCDIDTRVFADDDNFPMNATIQVVIEPQITHQRVEPGANSSCKI